MIELVRVAGAHWTVECNLQQAKGETALDHCEVRRYDAWYRHVTSQIHRLLATLVWRLADHPGVVLAWSG